MRMHPFDEPEFGEVCFQRHAGGALEITRADPRVLISDTLYAAVLTEGSPWIEIDQTGRVLTLTDDFGGRWIYLILEEHVSGALVLEWPD